MEPTHLLHLLPHVNKNRTCASFVFVTLWQWFMPRFFIYVVAEKKKITCMHWCVTAIWIFFSIFPRAHHTRESLFYLVPFHCFFHTGEKRHARFHARRDIGSIAFLRSLVNLFYQRERKRERERERERERDSTISMPSTLFFPASFPKSRFQDEDASGPDRSVRVLFRRVPVRVLELAGQRQGVQGILLGHPPAQWWVLWSTCVSC